MAEQGWLPGTLEPEVTRPEQGRPEPVQPDSSLADSPLAGSPLAGSPPAESSLAGPAQAEQPRVEDGLSERPETDSRAEQSERSRLDPAQPEPRRSVEHVAVRVQNPAEEPLDHAILTATELDGRQVARAESSGDGCYDLGPLERGSYVLIVRCPGYRPYAEVIELGDGLPRRTRIELSSDSGLAGVVRRKDGDPVAAATVTLKDDHGVVMTARTGPDGDYRVTGVRPGAYTMLVTARVCRPVELAVDVPERGLSRQDVELIGGAHVQGTVRVDHGRKVLPGTRILLLDDNGSVLATTDTDDQGRYRFSEVNAGEYTVCATPPSPAVSTVRIDGGLVHELDLELRQST